MGQEGSRKLEALPSDTLAEIAPQYDHVLIEGDGSRMLPLKAWADYEPVVPPYTTITVGILPLWTLGMQVSETIIHRLPLFTALTGAEQNQILSVSHLVPVIAGNPQNQRKGLFSAAQGEKILFFNQVETEAALSNAVQLVSMLPKDFLAKMHGIIAGSVQQDRIFVL
jgi:probable selenium-dependent hydroxylase accessory protein YqeC